MSVVSNNQSVNGAQFIGAWVNEIGLSGPNAALLFLNALETQRSSARVQTSIKKLRASAKYKQFLNKKLERNRELQNFIKNHGTGDDGEKSMTMRQLLEAKYKLDPPPAKPTSPKETDYENNPKGYRKAMSDHAKAMKEYDGKYKTYTQQYDKAKQQAVRYYGLDTPEYKCDLETSAITTTGRTPLGKNTDDRMSHSISVNDLTVEETRLRGEADSTDSGRELELVMVQAALSRQQQLTGLMSSIIKKTNEAANGVVRNI
jgi:hypothetical protein